ncbi:hypothetical protein HZS_5688 [Henneguya salminicola]|nr:hypothetical protein HZS_5688 [Henneguya salminicola]
MRDSPKNENQHIEDNQSRKEVFWDFLKCNTFLYQLVLTFIVLFSMICFAITTFRGGLLSFSKFFAFVLLISILIDFTLRSLNYHVYLPNIVKSTHVLSGLYGFGTLVSFVLSMILISKVDFRTMMIGGLCNGLVGILLAIPAFYFGKTWYSNGFCIIKDFPI